MQKLHKHFTFTICTLLLSSSVIGNDVQAESANLRLSETLEIDASDLIKLRIEARAGDMIIRGKSGQDNIVVEATILTSEQRDYTLSLTKNDDVSLLVAESNSSDSWWGKSPYIDLEISIPKHLELEIDDRSGDITISDIGANVNIDDRSGDIAVSDIAGSVKINDRSGDVTIDDVEGFVVVDDKSGDLDIKNVGRDIDIDDSSGDIELFAVGGDVIIEDSSGDIIVNTAESVNIVSDSSGDTRMTNIRSHVHGGK